MSVHGVMASTGVCQTLSDGSSPSGRSINTVDFGELGRYVVVVRLIERGYIVSRPITENASYDLIADDGNRLYRVQVKIANRVRGRLVARFSTVVQRKHRYYTSKDIDWLMLVDAGTKDTYLFDFTAGLLDGKTTQVATSKERW